MRRTVCLGLLALLLLALPASAAKLPPAGSGTIALATAEPVSFADTVAFTTTGTSSLKNPRVYVACYQNGVLVYGEAGSPSGVFTLGGGSSDWVTNGGGPADCTATLYYFKTGNREWNGHGLQEAVSLASTSFYAEA